MIADVFTKWRKPTKSFVAQNAWDSSGPPERPRLILANQAGMVNGEQQGHRGSDAVTRQIWAPIALSDGRDGISLRFQLSG